MCGIAGIISRNGVPLDHWRLDRMLDAIRHRGPDSRGTFYGETLAIGAHRLAIVDVRRGVQPTWSPDGNVLAVFNGEIFNHEDLRKLLEKQGYVFSTKCDTELIPALYQHYGRDFVHELNGQFAIGLYDFNKQAFFAWRDPVGICPFFYSVTQDKLLFGSEIKALLAHGSLNPALDLTGLDQILTFPGPISPRTLFKGIHALPPGCRLEARRGEEPLIENYWDFQFDEDDTIRSVESWVDELETLLFDAVRIRRSSEQRTGIYLSGGIDSSLVASMLRRLCKGEELHTFSIEFRDRLLTEAAHQDCVRRALAAKGHVFLMSDRDVLDRLEAVVWHTETPVRETFNAASLALSQMARQQRHKVVLAGQGADELFAGYVGYRFDAKVRGVRAPADQREQLLNERLWGDPNFLYETKYAALGNAKKKFYSPAVRETLGAFECTKHAVLGRPPSATATSIQRRSYVDLKLRLADHLLSGHGDRMSMANGVEVRYPFLDKRVVSAAARMPDLMKLRDMKEKFVVKKVGERWLPAQIVDREKFGFSASGSPMLLALKDDRVEELLSEERIKRQNLFDVEEIRRLKVRYSQPGFRLAVPFETDFLIVAITFALFSDLFGIDGI